MKRILALLLAFGPLACEPPPPPSASPRSHPFEESRIVDLSHAFDANTLYWPSAPEGFVLETVWAGETEQGFFYAANRFRAPSTAGPTSTPPPTSPRAVTPSPKSPSPRLVGPGLVVDVREACAADPDYAIPVADFESWEAEYGTIPERSIVLLLTGYGEHWPDRERYLGSSATGPEAVSQLHFPGLSAEAARWLVEERGVASVGIDTASIDRGASRDFAAHQVLAAANTPAMENLARLETLPTAGFTVFALPMKIAGGTGAPLRAIAALP